MPSINGIGAERQHAIAAAVEKQQPFAATTERPRGSTMRLSSLNAPTSLPSLSKARSAPYPLPFVPDALVTRRGIVATLCFRVRPPQR